ncbi:NUDIX hydrolase [Candidatus Woesebacteria bacterium]|nr:MAG: NUDIX hydrolase [Candidatus Woesebacteria bacterium]
MIKYRYCPQCKNKLDKKGPHFLCKECEVTIYTNPKPTACVFIVNKGKVLINKRAVPPKANTYDIPGGFLEPGESPSEAAIREIKEETGLTIKLLAIVGIYKEVYDGYDLINIFYAGEILSGKLTAADDVKDLAWVRIDQIPKMGFNSVNQAVDDFKIWHQNISSKKV